MKKYIRTKDGRIIANPEVNILWTRNNKDEDFVIKETNLIEGKNGACLKEDIIIEANTIKDLCDYFVVEYTFGDHTMFRHFCDLERHYELYTQDYHHVAGRYGAIWVAGKGLIYVAKMNEEGELELI